MKQKFECGECDAYGSISYNLDSEFYAVTVCPFCGAELSINDDSDSDVE